MRIREEANGDEFVINLTSLIDVVFLLLLFYMVTTTFLDPERSLEVELPGAVSGSEPPAQELVINVLEDGRLLLGGEELDRAELLVRLRSAAARSHETPVTIRGHRLARHEAIVSVMDACGQAGLTQLSVGTTPEERG